MVRSSVLVVCLVSVFAFNFVECAGPFDSFKSKIDVNFVKNIADFVKANPGIQLQPLIKQVSFNGQRVQLTHRMGNRIGGDRLLASEQTSQQWNTPQDIRLNLNYPKAGFAEVITYLEVITEQSNNMGKAYVTSGGIGQRRISVIVEAKQTFIWSYRASIFGY